MGKVNINSCRSWRSSTENNLSKDKLPRILTGFLTRGKVNTDKAVSRVDDSPALMPYNNQLTLHHQPFWQQADN